jgi:ABC-type glycerol-3-phosphate transport system permease component
VSFLRRPRFWRNALLNLLTFLAVAWAVGPMIWAVSSSFKALDEIYSFPPTILPLRPTLENYQVILEGDNFLRYFLNSGIVTAVTVVITVVLALLGAYAFARFRFPMRAVLLLLVLVPRIIPSITRVVPLYQLWAELEMLNTYTALILPYAADALPIGIWILIGFFQAITKELEEAAMIDGCSRFGALWRIIIPLTLPGVVEVALFTFLRSWNGFILAFTFVDTDAMRSTIEEERPDAAGRGASPRAALRRRAMPWCTPHEWKEPP